MKHSIFSYKASPLKSNSYRLERIDLEGDDQDAEEVIEDLRGKGHTVNVWVTESAGEEPSQALQRQARR